MMNWLDTETKELLQRLPPEKFAPPDTEAFSLILLAAEGADHTALARVVQRLADATEDGTERLVHSQLPICVKQGLSYSDAQIAQFELICCDAISVIVADRVVANAPADYLTDLFAMLRQIDEFELVTVRIDCIPDSPSGREFYDRFFCGPKPALAGPIKLMRKKARIMQHWVTQKPAAAWP